MIYSYICIFEDLLSCGYGEGTIAVQACTGIMNRLQGQQCVGTVCSM
jgi:hypothetical protein